MVGISPSADSLSTTTRRHRARWQPHVAVLLFAAVVLAGIFQALSDDGRRLLAILTVAVAARILVRVLRERDTSRLPPESADSGYPNANDDEPRAAA